MNPTNRCRIAVDIGGTFTDGVIVDEATGEVWIDKVPTSDPDPSDGFFSVVERLALNVADPQMRVGHLIHATTIATNAVLQRRGSKVALLVTRGFRDILEIARQVRYELYNLQTDKPMPLVPRSQCFEVSERLDYSGRVLQALDEQTVAEIATGLDREGVDAIAICFLHAYRNPVHELRAAEVIRERAPRIHVSTSSAIAPEIREYWRASTTAVNAYIAPTVARYLDSIERGLEERRFRAPLHVMQSNGGVMTAASARERPFQLIESGPAAGAAGAAFIADRGALDRAISYDMGGTTAKVALIVDGKPAVVPEWEVGSAAGSGTGFVKASGYPVLGSVVDLVEIGAGGGSIAWVDSGGILRVGPESAGATPGPACYGRGGEQPTVTDANLVLGRLDPNYFLGGELKLRERAALEAIAKCATRLGSDVESTSMAIVDIADAAMSEAIRLVTIGRGHDPAAFALIAFGGAGPLHANRLAAGLGIEQVIVPPSPGVMSALGLLLSDVRVDRRKTVLRPLDQSVTWCEDAFVALESECLRELESQGIDRSRMDIRRLMDLRYVGQSWKLSVDIGGAVLNVLGSEDGIREAFHAAHRRAYGYSVEDEPVEIVNLGVSAVGILDKPVRIGTPAGRTREAKPTSVRPVYFAEAEGFVETAVLNRYSLEVGAVIDGPALVEEVDSTTLVHPAWRARISDDSSLVITRSVRTP